MNAKLVLKNVFFVTIGGAFALTAWAQWQWIDKDGRKVFSDRSPPAEIQEENILKRPGNHQLVPVSASAAALSKASAPRLSGKDAQLEARKKQAEEEDAAKKKAEAGKIEKARADNCERARKGLASFQSGVRIAVTNAKGEREIMDDNARALETKRLQGIAGSDCT
ncbi:MAG: hypothetical protein A3E79_15515 [Burkholderiales bacterium RIFCSPHIGHO2_12_FULL_61_11]|nr:MAG: hypothetical protein A3E79_15515 [Burkholderiales bacterium RIFCSPHIGHO2_12_FULL_61_11]